MESPLQKMIDRQVIVKTGDVVYRGRLVEITEEAVCLKAKTGWREIAIERIVSINLQPDQEVAGSTEDDSDSEEKI